jgi:hypothetical protein
VSDQGETARLPLLKSLKDMAKSGAKLDASIVTTYAFNGLFYEEVLLRAFERAGSRLNVVLVDAAQLDQPAPAWITFLHQSRMLVRSTPRSSPSFQKSSLSWRLGVTTRRTPVTRTTRS